MDIFWIILIALAGLFAILVAVVMIRAARFPRKAEKAAAVQSVAVDLPRLAKALAEGIRCKTVSHADPALDDRHAFLQFRLALEKAFPFVERFTEKKDMGNDTLVYIWKGAQPQLKPVVLTAHQDVVPADPQTLSQWEHEPFGGDIDGEMVWGRGTLDIKSQIYTLLQAAELLMKDGFRPQRSVIFAFGHDEEVLSIHGAKNVVDWLKAEGIEPEVVLDEGGYLVQGFFKGIDVPVAVIGVAEKGYLTLELIVSARGGHSSLPPRESAITILARAILALQKNPMRADLKFARQLFEGIGTAAPWFFQVAFANLWLFKGIIERILSRIPYADALMRTTTAPTMLSGGVKENILPQQVSAKVNFRILPGDTTQSVTEHVRRVINDERVEIKFTSDIPNEPSIESDTSTPAYQVLERVIRSIYGEVPVAPFLVLGATDARHYLQVTDRVYRFTPYLVSQADMQRVHGVNERISFEMLEKMTQTFHELIKLWSQKDLSA